MKLLDGLGTLWRQNPNEKIVIFATYLGPGHDRPRDRADLPRPGRCRAARRRPRARRWRQSGRFRQKDGPRVWSARRPGAKASTCNSVFNFDLPWNPMDMEQRIRVHSSLRQRYTAVGLTTSCCRIPSRAASSACLDGSPKIARTVGKVDHQGNVAETCARRFLAVVGAVRSPRAAIRRHCPTGIEAHAGGAGGGAVDSCEAAGGV